MIPLSFAQQRLWFLQQVDPSPAYNVAFTLQLRGAVDPDALQQALIDLARRHEVLRTVFPEVDGQPVQQILDHACPELSRHFTTADAVDRLLTEAAAYVFALGSEIPIHAHLFTITDTDHRLSLVVHHIAADGWSLQPLINDLTAAYEARCHGNAPGWEPLPIQYADYTLWQHDLLGDPADATSVAGKQLAYWSTTLAGMTDELRLPTDRPRPAEPSHDGALASVIVDGDLHTRLVELASSAGATLFMTLQAAVAALVTRIGAGTDIPLGTAVAGRVDEALEDLVGFFVNTLVLRTNTAGNPTFRDLLGRVRETDLAAYAHQDLPFERIVEELNPARSLARHPLFQVMLVLQSQQSQSSSEPPASPSGLAMEMVPTPAVSAKFDLTIAVSEIRSPQGAPDGMVISFEYATDLFDRARIEHLLALFVSILRAMSTDPSMRIGDVDLLSRDERALIVGEWAGSSASLPDDLCVHQVFERQVALTPEAPALVFGDVRVSYGQLDARANQLAHHLHGCGVERGEIVGVYLDRGVELVVAVLAVLKAGAGYTLLDTAFPLDRLAAVVADAGVTTVVSGGTEMVNGGDRWRWLDVADPAVEGHPVSSPDVAVSPSDVVCVMFTSGSTGRPKGVVSSHRSLVGTLLGQDFIDFGPGEVVLQSAPVSWDAFALELFAALLFGGCAVLQPGQTPEPEVIADLVAGHAVTTLHASASLLNFLIDEYPQVFKQVRQVMTGGEAASVPHLAHLLDMAPSTRVINGYSPVESMIFTVSHQVTAADVAGTSIPVGKPLNHKRVYVLDEHLGVVPIGVIGELYMAGVGLARGYLGQPGLTASRFVANPFDPAGGRMYRTGDLVRWRADGVLEFCGRADDQVKIRGFRVEPGEVEAVIGRHPAVGQVAVIVREDRPGDKRLVAYLVIAADQELDPVDLRRTIGESLPEYLMPSAFVTLDELPRTGNGKLDRNALPAPEITASATSRRPRNPREEILCGLFTEILGVPGVGIDDDFFALGGHSLLVTRLISKARTKLDGDLSIKALFATPTPGGLADFLATAKGVRRPALRSVVRPDRLPLSFAQQRLWFLQRVDPSAAYNVAFTLRLRGSVDADALHQALADVVARHEALRTVFPEVDGQPVQQILDHAYPELSRHRTTVDAVDRLLIEAAAYVFALGSEIPIHAHLFTITDTDHRLSLVMHHIAADGWSLQPLINDLTAAYEARCHGNAPGWEPLPIQYADYTLWQHDLLGDLTDPSSAFSAQLAFWRDALTDLPEEITLPIDRPRPIEPSGRGDTVRHHLREDLHRRLIEVARAEQVTVFMALQTLVATLLSRLGAGDDIPLGTPVLGRDDAAMDDLIGFFVNTLVLRTDVCGDPTFRDLLGRVRTRTIDAFSHQDVPFERVVEELNPTRVLGRHPLFQVMIALQNNTVGESDLGDAGMDLEAVGTDSAKFDLSIDFVEARTGDGSAAGLDVFFEYATDLFDRGTVETMAVRLERVIEGVLADPDQPVASVAVLSVEEERHLLIDVNGDIATYADTTLAEMVANQVAASPDAVALVYDGRRDVTYRELDTSARHWAGRLAATGAGPESIVAIAVPRGPDLVVALLATLYAGAAYLPLDPDYPPDRIAFMLADADPACVLTTTEVAGTLRAATPVLLIDGADDGPTVPVTPPKPDNPAYLIYTSGSTGKPKGAVATHRAIVNQLSWRQSFYHLRADDRMLHKTPSSFDVAVLEIFWPLTTGATVVIARPGGHRDPAYLAELIRAQAVTIVDFVPVLLDAFLREPATRDITTLRRVFSGGEALTADLRTRFGQVFDVPLHNAYGPTEAAIDITQFTCVDEPGPIPIGRPNANARVYVLDDRLRLVPIGHAGELYLAGPQLARGYHQRPGLTSARFVADPYGEPGARLYRTGDLVRWRRDGMLEYLGRTDDQVKIRGLRIELGEIEAVLGAHPSLVGAVVLAREDQPGDRRLVAYPITGGASVTSDELRDFLAARLPDYLVPQAYVLLDALPVTPAGKVDFKALPAPQTGAGPGRAPRTPQEEILCGLYAELLNVPSVGVDDNFFALGGHSLLAVRLINRVREALGSEIDVRDIFLTPTPSGLVGQLGRVGGRARPALTAVARPQRLPLSHAQQRLWFLHQMEPSSAYTMATALRLRGEWHGPELRAALHDVVTRHEALRTVFPERDDEPVQYILDALDAAPVWTEARCDEAGLAEAINAAAGHVFDLATDRPLRADVLVLSPEDHVLVLVMHHITADGWSMGPLLGDLATAYAARRAGAAPVFEQLGVQYADYTLWQHDVLGNPADPDSVFAGQLDYWRTQLADLPDQLELPTDRPRPPAPTYRGETLELAIPPALHAAMADIARTHQVTLYMVLQAAVATLLHRLGAGNDIPLGSVVAGRTDAALDDLIGFFVNTLVLRTDTAGNPTFADLLARVRETDLSALSHQELPFDQIVESLRPTRSLARHPLFQVMLVLQNTGGGGEFTLGDLDVDFEQIGQGGAKFDLTMVLSEQYADDGAAAGIHASFEYATDLFDRDTVAAFAGRLVRLLEAVSAAPGVPIDDVDLLSATERACVLHEWQGAQVAFPLHRSVPELIAARATAAPDAPAVVSGEITLSYAGLDRRANQVANSLVETGVRPGTLVGLCMERGADMIVGMLGILKAGAAYVPLDPNYPAARLAFLIEDTAMPVILTQKQLISLVSPSDAAMLRIDALDAATPTTAPAVGASPDGVAYVCHTSGSTGTPKGVVIRHRALTDMCLDHAARYAITPADRTSQVAAQGFDATVWEIWPYLCAGAAVHLPDQMTLDDADALLDWIVASDLTTCFLPTPRLELLIDEERLARTKLRWLFTAGDVLRRTPPPGAMFTLMNLYGPTEYTVVATGAHVPAYPSETLPPIGRPVANTTALVLDEALRPVPVGMPGELYLAGSGVAAGYLNKPGLTSTRFVANPYGPPGEPMYRTGDVIRWLPSGELSFIGRVDDQVKIRGVRIELGEIEAALGRHPDVRQVVVLVCTDPGGTKRLVAYVAGDGVTVAELRRHAGLTLPDYLIPAVFAMVDVLPLTANGKLDRKALPDPVWRSGSAGRAPRTARERVLAEIFAETLGIATVSIDDNFFDLGGHSLLATRMISRIRSATGVALSIRALFAAPTPAALAEQLDAGPDEDALAMLLPLRSTGGRAPLFCVHPAAGISWVYAGLLRHLGADQPIYGLQARGFTRPKAGPASIAEMVTEYLAQVRSVQPHGPYNLLGWSFGGVVAHAMAARLQADGEQVALLSILDGYPAADDPQAEPMASDDPRALAELLQSLGFPLGDGAVSAADYDRLARAEGSPLAALDDAAIAALPSVFVDNGNAMSGFDTGVYDGDLLFFAATGDPGADPTLWRQHVTGAIDVFNIACRHGEMLQPAPLNEIGPVLAGRLSQLTNQLTNGGES